MERGASDGRYRRTILRHGRAFACLAVASLTLAIASSGALAADGAANGRPAATPAAEALSLDQAHAVEQIVHDYLLRNPQVILDAVRDLQQKRHDEAQAAARSAIAQHRHALLNDPDSPVAGNPQGEVTVVEFFDYRCPYCKQVEASLAQLRKDDRQVRFVYKEFPILGPDSVTAARAALAARKQNKYQQMHDALIRAHGRLTQDTILDLAASAGLDVARLKSDMDSPEVESIITHNMALARALSIHVTPAFIVGDQPISGAVDLPTLQKLVQTAVAETRK